MENSEQLFGLVMKRKPVAWEREAYGCEQLAAVP